MYEPSQSVRDPRCPYCGRPVLGTFVQGREGLYHPACVEPPVRRLPTLPEDPAHWPAEIVYPNYTDLRFQSTSREDGA